MDSDHGYLSSTTYFLSILYYNWEVLACSSYDPGVSRSGYPPLDSETETEGGLEISGQRPYIVFWDLWIYF